MSRLPARGEPIPQTVEELQRIMARDAELLLEADREITRLKVDNERLRQKLMKRGKNN